MPTTIILYTYIFILGAVLGSFYNVVGMRIPLKQSIAYPGSACPVCSKKLTALELIPIFSYLFQNGKCKNCKTSISPLYPSIELVTAILFTISPMLVGWSKELILAWSLISLCMIVTVSDLKYMIIPDKVNLFFLVLFTVERVFIPADPWYDPIAGFLVGGLVPLVVILVSRGGMGGGDMKLLAVFGIILGWKLVLLCFFLATLVGTIVGFLGMMRGSVKKGKPFPFGPFLVVGALLSYFFGNELIHLYLSYFFSYFY
ncbi:leader peptidase (prepilin peptidase)/N-methyltransferase [Metabacillus crassostreae]|uniref:prepilin peptidase n=1 Tax=Metabacillus crassostreae TaxID=929098 RepID=UPI0019580D36|nr:A24 family peptidase [Metabacillus crassostreae]MBM7605742.1 leader peptidase (prepilin peptidase)/N-methyltransferase [Metabacillus crassostreae]